MTAPSTPGFATLGLDHIVLRVADVERSIAFYRAILGCREERRVASIGLVQMRAGSAMIDLVPAKGERAGGDLDHFALRIAPWDADAILAHLEAHGVKAEAPALRYWAEGEGWSIYFDDPDGHTVELKGPPIA